MLDDPEPDVTMPSVGPSNLRLAKRLSFRYLPLTSYEVMCHVDSPVVRP